MPVPTIPPSCDSPARGARRRGRVGASALHVVAALLLLSAAAVGAVRPPFEAPPTPSDPWSVADAMLARGERAAARAFASGLLGPDAEALRAWVARAPVPTRGEARAATRPDEASTDGGDPSEAPPPAPDGPPPPRTPRAARSRSDAPSPSADDDAREALRLGDAVALALASGDLGAEATSLERLGRLERRRGGLDAALAAFRRAGAVHERTGDLVAAAAAQRALGIVAVEAGARDEALDAERRALALSERAGDRAGCAAALGNLGGIHWLTGEYAESLACQERALDLLVLLRDERRETATLCNLGAVHQRLGDGERALACYERAFPRLEAVEDRGRLATVLANAGALHASRGDPDRALAYLERARVAFEETGDRKGVADAYVNEGHVRACVGNVEAAWRAHGLALEAYEALGDREGAVQACTALGLDEAARGEPERALSYLRRAVDGAETHGAQDALVVALWATATVRLRAGEPHEAMAAARRAIEEMPSMVGRLGDEQGALVRGRLAPIFDVGLEAAAAVGDAEQVAYFAESGRAGALLEALGGRDRLREVVLPAELRAAEGCARADEARTLASYRRALDADDLASARVARAAHEAAREGLRAVIERIRREAKSAAHLVYPRAASLAELRAGLARGEVLVTYAVSASRALALVVARAGSRIVPLGALDRIEAACEALEMTESPGHDPAAAVEALRRLVVDPLDLPPATTRVLVSPDGALSYAPFSLLFGRREVACVPSGTTWQLLGADADRRGVGVLALGDPDYESDGPGVNRLARMRSGVGFPALPHTGAEAKSVGDVVLLGADATEAGLRFAVGRRARWRAVHLACHGLVDARAPLLSALALTPSGDDDGFLTALDVLSMRVPTDLAVLSACRTGRGGVVRGEGVVGFVRAFMFAGASRVVVSLWNGDDEATRMLMCRFHLEIRQGRSTARALVEAQAAVRAVPRWAHPYYWAGWILWGLPD